MPFDEHWLWFIVMIVCLFVEAATFGLTTIWFAIGALVMIFLSFTGMSLQIQILLFLCISFVLLVLTRPFALKKLKIKKVATNTDVLIGKTAVVTKKILPTDRGEIRVDGKYWTAKTENETDVFEPEEQCTVAGIEGVAAIVSKLKK